MTEPTMKTVLEAIDEFDTIGEDMFLKGYAAGVGPRTHIFVWNGRAYPLKAVWAAAHKPPISPRDFNTKDAVRGLQALDFDCFKLID